MIRMVGWTQKYMPASDYNPKEYEIKKKGKSGEVTGKSQYLNISLILVLNTPS